MHFYIYNECPMTVSATIEFIDANSHQLARATILVPPGQQKMGCFTNDPSVSSEAVIHDGSLHWERQAFQLVDREYTHVLTCHCVGPECPQKYSLADSRQSPMEEKGAEPGA